MCGCGAPVLAQGHIFTAAFATISVCFLYRYIPRKSLIHTKQRGSMVQKNVLGPYNSSLESSQSFRDCFLGNRIPQRYFFISPLDMMYHFLLSTNRILGHQNELAKFGCANLSKEEYDYENLSLITCNPFLRQIAVMTTAEKPSLPLTMKRVQLHVCTFDRHKL